LKTTEESVGALLSFGQALRAIQAARGGDKTWLALNLTMTQFKALLIVADTGGLTSRGLSKCLGIGPSAVTSLVDKLVERKLVRREDDPEDRRVAWVRPTPKALGLRDKLLETNRSVLTEIVEHVSLADREHMRQTITRLAQTAQGVLARSKERATE
jgi:DNA-binding MarR family transcriptional regulator